ncbi:MAG: M48 family metalloprotease [Saprospiraceae bacterium]|nr:M48 family metalloprotease [Saprospiraceae bacterium]
MQIEISDSFKKMTARAIAAIVLFIVVYLVLLVLCVALTLACFAAGLGMIVAAPSFLTIGLGLGLAGLGFFIFVFVIKFIFKKHEVDRADLLEVSREQEPELFQFIQEIVDEVKTDFPKKVYLSSDVNASVFYDSSFWSMFLPIRKNLQIGMGLVNSVTEQEFKAILAHEFGHFSQRSMKVGSFVYNVNQVIFNMLNDNESMDTMMAKWASVSGYFSIFVALAVRIIQGIQWILRKMYDFVNLSYMALSREMEFHADEVAANVAGSRPLKESLLRINLASRAYHSVIDFYNNQVANGLKSPNLYQEHAFVMQFYAKTWGYPLNHHLPIISVSDLGKYNKSKLIIKDQWASHPSTEDRVEALDTLGITKEKVNNGPANTLFKNVEKIQQDITDRLFAGVVYESGATLFKIDEFQHAFVADFQNNDFDGAYNAYYDSRNTVFLDVETLKNKENTTTFEHLFNNEKVDQVYEYVALENDIQVLEGIAKKAYDIKTFDYEGIKYKVNEAESLIPKLQTSLEKLSESIAENDRAIFVFFHSLAQKQGKEDVLLEKYRLYFEYDKDYDRRYKIYFDLAKALEFVNVTTPFEQISHNFTQIRPLEVRLKQELQSLFKNPWFVKEINPDTRTNFDNYLSQDWVYFKADAYEEDVLAMLFAANNDYRYLINRAYFLMKKDLLAFQITLVTEKANG